MKRRNRFTSDTDSSLVWTRRRPFTCRSVDFEKSNELTATELTQGKICTGRQLLTQLADFEPPRAAELKLCYSESRLVRTQPERFFKKYATYTGIFHSA